MSGERFGFLRDSYLAHYNGGRPPRGFALGIPAPPPAIREAGARTGPVIERTDVLGGLIHEYRRAA
jgi:hypothetical protein